MKKDVGKFESRLPLIQKPRLVWIIAQRGAVTGQKLGRLWWPCVQSFF